MSGGGGWEVVGISGMGGSGKTTLAMEIFKDHKVRGKENKGQISTIFSLKFFQSFFVQTKIASFHELLGCKNSPNWVHSIFGGWFACVSCN
jgi:deoxyadenosine/deoxycytidine kinase